MLLGRFENAWRESDAISARGGRAANQLWDGHHWDNNRVIIRCLHGYRGLIQFIRYAPLVRKIASRVIVQTHPEMVSLFRCVSGIDEIATWDDAPGREKWDRQIEITDLPGACLQRSPRSP